MGSEGGTTILFNLRYTYCVDSQIQPFYFLTALKHGIQESIILTTAEYFEAWFPSVLKGIILVCGPLSEDSFP